MEIYSFLSFITHVNISSGTYNIGLYIYSLTITMYLLSPMYPYPVTVHFLPVTWLVPRAGRQTRQTPSFIKSKLILVT